MRVGPEYFRLIGHYERGKANDPNCRLTESGAALDAYLCPAGVPTIGVGSTKRMDGSPVEMGDTITEAQVFELAERDAEDAASAVREINRPLTQYQFDGLTAFTQNLGRRNLANLLPMIEEGRWEDVAVKMGEYVRAWGRYEGRWYYMALLGLRIRRFSEGLLTLGYDWEPVCNADDIGMPKKRPPEWQPNGTAKDGSKGRYFDVLLPGATEFAVIEATARKLPDPELILTNKAEPRPSSPAASAGQPGVSAPSPLPAAPAQQKPAETVPSGPAVKAGPAAPNVPAKAQPVPSPAPRVEPPPKPPVIMPPSVQVNAQPDMGPTTRTMWVSKRFWGGVLIIGGRLIIAADVTGTFAPAVKAFIGDGILMDWGTGVIVTVLGEMIFHQGEKKAEGPMDTPKRIALMTPAP